MLWPEKREHKAQEFRLCALSQINKSLHGANTHSALSKNPTALISVSRHSEMDVIDEQSQQQRIGCLKGRHPLCVHGSQGFRYDTHKSRLEKELNHRWYSLVETRRYCAAYHSGTRSASCPVRRVRCAVIRPCACTHQMPCVQIH